jgi:predicted  nucleic acid-binding Zn-ribbon protein
MPQESYADFSIIQKYLDQKKYYDEAKKTYADKLAELDTTITALRDELNAKDQAISQLQFQLAEAQSLIKEREKSVQEVNIQMHRLKQQMEPSQAQQGSPVFEDAGAKKAKFGFLK